MDKKKISQIDDFYARWLLGQNGHEDLLLDFINTFMLDSKMKTFESLIIKNPFNLKDSKDDTQSIVDVSAKTDTGANVIIEIQISGNIKFANRALFYWAENYTNIDTRTIDYSTLKPVVSINIVDFIMRHQDPRPHTTYMITDIETHETLTDMLIMHFLELKKHQNAFNTKGLEMWSRYFTSDNLGKEAKMLIKEKPILEKAIEYYYDFNEDKDLVGEYERRLAFKVGQAQMLHQEREEGIEQGIGQGREERNIEIATRMLALDIDIEIIIKATGLSKEHILSI